MLRSRYKIFLLPAIAALVLAVAVGCDSGQEAKWKQKYERAANRAGNAESRVESLKQKNEKLSEDLRSVRSELKACKEKQVQLKSDVSSAQAELNSRVNSLRERLENQEERARKAREKASKARDRVEKLQKEYSTTVEKLRETGQKLFRTSQYLGAEVMLKRAVQLGSTTPQAAYAIGYCRGRASDYEEAVTWYEKAIEKLRADDDPNELLFAKALNNCAAAYEDLGKLKKARQLYAEAISVHDKFAPAHFNLGRLYRQELDKPGKAISHLRRHVALGGSRTAAAKESIRSIQAAQNRASSAEK